MRNVRGKAGCSVLWNNFSNQKKLQTISRLGVRPQAEQTGLEAPQAELSLEGIPVSLWYCWISRIPSPYWNVPVTVLLATENHKGFLDTKSRMCEERCVNLLSALFHDCLASVLILSSGRFRSRSGAAEMRYDITKQSSDNCPRQASNIRCFHIHSWFILMTFLPKEGMLP